jgi:hypothetical protein
MKKKDIKLPNTSFSDAILNVQKEHGQDQNITIIRPNKLKEKDRFVKVFQLGLSYFIDNLTPSGCKLFMYFIAISEYQNYVEVDQQIMQKKLQIGRTALNKGLKELQEVNVIKIIPDLNDKRRNTYVINHYVMWKGNPGDRIRSIKSKKDYFLNPNQLSLELKENNKENS